MNISKKFFFFLKTCRWRSKIATYKFAWNFN